MRYSEDHKAKTHQRIVDEAALRFRRDGVLATGLQPLMKALGLTHGGFYAHFKSKDDLVAAGIGQMFEEAKGRMVLDATDLTAAQRLTSYIGFYLSPQHRDTRSASCTVAIVASSDSPSVAATAPSSPPNHVPANAPSARSAVNTSVSRISAVWRSALSR